MKVTLVGMGTRGDAQPAVALGKGLKAAGYQVRVVASKGFESWIESHGLEAARSSVDIRALMDSEGGRDWVESGNNPVRELQKMRELLADSGVQMARDVWDACQDADAVLASFTVDPFVLGMTEKRPMRYVRTMLQPLIATRDAACFPNMPFPGRSWLNLPFAHFALRLMWSVHAETSNRFRREVLKLPQIDRKTYYQRLAPVPLLHGFSEHVIPRAAEWGADVHTTGYWFLDDLDGWQPPQALLDFLSVGEPPVCLGFGSMTGRNAEATTALVLDAVQRSGQRAILLSGWAGVGQRDLPPNVYVLEAAPHSWLFPKVAAVVHHGGAGTTAAGLRAGVPSIVVPHFADQPLWAARVKALGVGPQPIPRSKLTSERLAQAIRQAVTDREMQRRAAALGEKLRAEDGVGNAVAVLGRYLG
ncbi:MAG: glycosyltransferase [Anaerolineae bacterium]